MTNKTDGIIIAIGWIVTFIVAFFVLTRGEDVGIFIPAMIVVIGMLGSVMLPTVLFIIKDSMKPQSQNKQKMPPQNKSKGTPATQNQTIKAYPRVLTEPVPDAPPERQFTNQEIVRLGMAIQWNTNAEQIAHQLFHQFEPESRSQAQNILRDLDKPMQPVMVIAPLFLSKGDLDELRGYVKLGNMDFRDLGITFERAAKAE